MGNQQGKLQHNQSGKPKKAVHWKSAEPPSAPGRPQLISLSEQQPDVVNLQWERPKVDGGSPILGYIVEHRRMGSPHWVRATPVLVARCEVSISGLEPGWRYQFRVFAENVVGRSQPSELSDILTVTLQRNAISVPRFIDELHDTHAVEDERIEFRVNFLGQPVPEINWFKDGYEIFSSRRTKIVNDNDSSVLIIHQVALTDEGEIKCTATNRAGHVVTKARLFVQAPPKIRLPRTYEDGLIIEADEVLRLKIGLAGQPIPYVTWLHEGEPIANAGRFEITTSDKNSMLKIDNVERNDRGEYSIRATNKLGEDVSSFLVTVTSKPDPPGRVRLNMSFGKSATLSWTAPIDDGGCKIGNYIVEYFRIGWNVWLKASTTRSLSTTLHDLIEGSEYKFRVKAENPYGVSDPSEESDVLFIPDPKRGITKPKSENQLDEAKGKQPVPPRRKTLSPQRPTADAATETLPRISPKVDRKLRPQILDNEDLLREMSYGTPDQVLKLDMRKSPSPYRPADKPTARPNQLSLSLQQRTEPKSPTLSPTAELAKNTLVLHGILKAQPEAPSSPSIQKTPTPPRSPVAETPILNALINRSSLSPIVEKQPMQPEAASNSTALQRSAEPVELGVNQHVRRYSNHALSPARNVPALAVAIATAGFNAQPATASANDIEQPKVSTPTIEISAPTPSIPPTITPAITTQSFPTSLPSTINPISMSQNDRHDDVHTSNEFMLVVFDKNSKVKDKDKQDSYELDLEDAIQPPPISISAPDLALLEYRFQPSFPLRRSVSSTELLYERAMARFYEAVELEEAEKARKLKISQDKLATPSNIQPTTTNLRKRLGSMTEAERLSFEKRSEMRRQSADMQMDIKAMHRWNSKDNITEFKPISRRLPPQLLSKRMESQESEELSDDYQALSGPQHDESYDLASDYTESTASSDQDSIEKFKIELMARTRSPTPKELETYHPRNMSAGVFTPYRPPSPDQAVSVLRSPAPLPSPDFVPKPILKRPSNENVLQNENLASIGANSSTNPDSSNGKGDNGRNDSAKVDNVKVDNVKADNEKPASVKLDLAKGIKSFFNREKKSSTEKNTEENELISNPQETTNAALIAAEKESKLKAKQEQEERIKREAERIMMEEARVAADHYSELVSHVTKTKKYHTPIYMDQEELKKIAEKADKENPMEDDESQPLEETGLIPPMSNKPRLSISERGQLMHVREMGSRSAMKGNGGQQSSRIPDSSSEDNSVQSPVLEKKQFSPPATPAATQPSLAKQQQQQENTSPPKEAAAEQPACAADDDGMITTTTVISETVEERPDARGRPRLVKVKRIIKRRIPSSTRSRDTSLSRPPPSSLDYSMQDNYTLPSTTITQRSISKTRKPAARMESKSPAPITRSQLSNNTPTAPMEQQSKSLVLSASQEMLAASSNASRSGSSSPTPSISDEEAHEKVRSALSYSTDMVLFVVACYVYLFKDARLVLPILALMIYRQLGEAINNCIPNWLRRKKPQ